MFTIIMLVLLYYIYKLLVRPVIVRLWDLRGQDLVELFKLLIK